MYSLERKTEKKSTMIHQEVILRARKEKCLPSLARGRPPRSSLWRRCRINRITRQWEAEQARGRAEVCTSKMQLGTCQQWSERGHRMSIKAECGQMGPLGRGWAGAGILDPSIVAKWSWANDLTFLRFKFLYLQSRDSHTFLTG